MDSPLVKTTVLNTVMAAISNVSGQIIHCWQHNKPYSLSVAEIASFAIYVALSVPPNYFFQNWLEAKFPGYEDVAIADPKARQKAAQEKIDTGKGSSADIAASDPEIRKRVASEDSLAQETPSKPAETPQQLNLRNLAIKLAVDQTVGMVVNTAGFIVGISLLRGQSWPQVRKELDEQLWPMVFAGQKVWTVVSILNFTLVPVEHRLTVSATVGLFWGIYLSLLAPA